jgi:uncharacterized protein
VQSDSTSGSDHDSDARTDVVRTLGRPQRRVLGVLLEKAFTTPDQYPMTLKSITAGCNQKSNRDPVSGYSEDAVMDALDELRVAGLVLELHTESGRTERYRHLMRQHYSFTEPQLAILTELMLRGRQTLGELRSRASRMVPIDGLDDLRNELDGLIADGFAQSNGPLERRGVEVDHGFYEPHESQARIGTASDDEAVPAPATAPRSAPAAPLPFSTTASEVENRVARLEAENREFAATVEQLQNDLRNLDERFQQFRDAIGG